MKIHPFIKIVMLAAIIFVIISCASPGSYFPTATAIPATMIPPTFLPPTATSIPPSPIPPTATNTPPTLIPSTATVTSAPPPPAGIALQFAPGGTSAYISTNINTNENKNYLVRAMKGQMMIARLDTPGNVQMDIRGVSDGTLLAANVQTWRGRLPLNQDYLLTVKNPGSPVNFTLDVIIPADIRFNPGTTSAALKGYIQQQAINTYLAWAKAGQTMSVTVSSPRGDVLLTIYGLEDGSPLVRYVSGASSWSGTLPGDQDYVIDLHSVGPATDYNLEVKIK